METRIKGLLVEDDDRLATFIGEFPGQGANIAALRSRGVDLELDMTCP